MNKQLVELYNEYCKYVEEYVETCMKYIDEQDLKSSFKYFMEWVEKGFINY